MTKHNKTLPGRIKRTCLACGCEFEVDRNVVLKGYGKFCSRNCTGKRTYGHYIAPKKNLLCVMCGKQFIEYESKLKSDATRGKCCSVKCRVEYTQKQISGDKNYRWKGGITPEKPLIRSRMSARNWSKAVKKRDSYTCQKCGCKENLHAHHIKSFDSFPMLRFDVDNGLTLCCNCHWNEHRLTQKLKDEKNETGTFALAV